MPSKKKPAAADTAALPSIPHELIEQLTGGTTPMTAEQINATTMALKKALIERALGAELSYHLGYPPGSARPEDAANQRNGKSAKTVLTQDGPPSHRWVPRKTGSYNLNASTARIRETSGKFRSEHVWKPTTRYFRHSRLIEVCLI
jgi:hypothetical protein